MVPQNIDFKIIESENINDDYQIPYIIKYQKDRMDIDLKD